jgi:hypothetical protein
MEAAMCMACGGHGAAPTGRCINAPRAARGEKRRPCIHVISAIYFITYRNLPTLRGFQSTDRF